MKAKKPIKAKVKTSVKRPSADMIKKMKQELQDVVVVAQEAFNIAWNRFEEIKAELECRREFLEDADDVLWEARSDLIDFDELVNDAKKTGNWKDVLNFKLSR